MKTEQRIDIVLKGFINQRSQMWQKYDKALEQEAELNKFREFDNSRLTAELPPMSKTNSPPDEVAAAVWELKQEVENIQRGESLINSCQSQIEETKKQFIIVVVAGVVVVILLLYFIISSFS